MAARGRSNAGRPKDKPKTSSKKKHTIGEVCRKCGSPMKRGRTVEDRAISGTIDGFTYTRCVHIAAKCTDPACGQAGTIRDLIA